MDLTKLFEMQKVLQERINYNEPDHFNKLKLALLVELGECCQEWRGFKFWSTDQEPRLKICEECGGDKVKGIYDDEDCFCENAKYPLLEEYVDCLHFVMELGLVINSDFRVPYNRIKIGNHSVTDKFNAIYLLTAKLELMFLLLDDKDYRILLTEYVELAEDLGFTWDQVEAAYYKKNKINHKRQEEGY